MQEWKMREHIAEVENAGVEIPGATKYGKPSEENILKYQTKYGFHAYLTVLVAKPNSQACRPVNVVTNHRQCVRCQQSYPRSGHQMCQETR